MKIALVAQNATPLRPRTGSGPDSDDIGLSELTRKLAGHGHQVTVYAQKNDPSQPDHAELHAGVRVEHINAGPVPATAAAGQDDAGLLERVPAFSGPLRSMWHRDRPDVVHALRWTSGLAALAAARDLGLPVVQEFSSLGVAERRAAARRGGGMADGAAAAPVPPQPALRRRPRPGGTGSGPPARPRPGSGSSLPSAAAPPRWSLPTPARSPTSPGWACTGPRSGWCHGAWTPSCSPRTGRPPSGTTAGGCSPRPACGSASRSRRCSGR